LQQNNVFISFGGIQGLKILQEFVLPYMSPYMFHRELNVKGLRFCHGQEDESLVLKLNCGISVPGETLTSFCQPYCSQSASTEPEMSYLYNGLFLNRVILLHVTQQWKGNTDYAARNV
jgi:hypothetical protein